jgi:hypothetical protein
MSPVVVSREIVNSPEFSTFSITFGDVATMETFSRKSASAVSKLSPAVI